MCVARGARCPPPQVVDQASGAVFTGESPTKPWTDVCVAHRTGQRISGPLFFGFSDAVTQRAIAANLYTPAELRAALLVGGAGYGVGWGLAQGPLAQGPRGRCLKGRVGIQALRHQVPAALARVTACACVRACVCFCAQGERVEADAATPEEAAARQFASVEGVGEATSILLARTQALGGRRHASLESLRGWAGASGAQAADAGGDGRGC